MSIVTFEKPCEHISLADWHGRLWELRQTADTRRTDAYDLRNSARQLRNETNIKTRWDEYHSTARLRDRATEVRRWRDILASCLRSVQNEIQLLTKEKAISDKALEMTINTPLAIVSECIQIRDMRHGDDLNHDEGFMELQNELAVVEGLKSMLTNKCQTAWEELNRLKEEEFKIQTDLDNKNAALEIDDYNLNMTQDCSGTSFKPDPLRIPKTCIPYEGWLERSRYNRLKADNEITASNKLREAMYCARERAFNDLRAQTDATDFALRKRIYETERAVFQLDWERKKMVDEIDKTMKELEELEFSLRSKTDGLKLAETRLENRLFRAGPELVYDEAQVGLSDQVLQLRQTRRDIACKIDTAKATYNALENHLVRIDQDLNNKKHALATDRRCMDARLRLAEGERAPPPTQIERNIILTRMEDQIPKT